jgi:hypothetical protein
MIGVLLSACTRRAGETVPVRKKLPVSAVIADSLYLSFPGEMRVTSTHILLETPFDVDGMLKIYDRATGREAGWVGKIGQGPGEWNAPKTGNILGDKVLIFDLNLPKYVFAEAGNMYREISGMDAQQRMNYRPDKMLFTDDGLFITADYMETPPFRLIANGDTLPGGHYPFPETISNTFDRFQGPLALHPGKRIVAYGIIEHPYLALYRIRSGGLEPVWEKQFKPADYSVTDGKLRWGPNQPAGVKELTFTRDYIACLTMDRENRENRVSMYSRGQEIKVSLCTVYLFDYEGNLRYILEPETHIIRLASDTESNLLYAVGIHPDFRMVTFDLDRVLEASQ